MTLERRRCAPACADAPGRRRACRSATRRALEHRRAQELGPSTSDGRCRVTSTYLRGSRPSCSATSSPRNARSSRQSVSIIVLPTKWMRSGRCLRAARFSTASSEWANRSRRTRPSTMRLISSGIERSKLRRPDSTCAYGDAELDGNERAGERRVDVARHDARSGCSSANAALEPLRARAPSARRARPSRRRAGRGRLREAELVEEQLRRARVVVLARVDERAARACRAAPAPRRPAPSS